MSYDYEPIDSETELQIVDFPSSSIDKILGSNDRLNKEAPRRNNYVSLSNTLNEEESAISQTNQALSLKYLKALNSGRTTEYYKNYEVSQNEELQIEGAVRNVDYEREYDSKWTKQKISYSIQFVLCKLIFDFSMIASYLIDSSAKTKYLLVLDLTMVFFLLPVYSIAYWKWKYVPTQPSKILFLDFLTCLVLVLNYVFDLSVESDKFEIFLIIKLMRVFDITFIMKKIIYHTAFHYSFFYSLLENGLHRYIVKMVLRLVNIVFLVSALFKLFSDLDPGFFNAKLMFTDSFYFTISTFTLVGSNLRTASTHSRLFLVVFFAIFFYALARVLIRLIYLKKKDNVPLKITEFSNHNVILGKLKESSLIKIIEEIYGDFNFLLGVKPPKTIILLNNSKFDKLKAHKFHMKLFFTFEILSLSNENLELLNLDSAACVFCLNHNKFEDQSRFINTVLFQCFRLASPTTSFFIQTNVHSTLRNFIKNYFFINTQDLRYNLLARSAFNKGYLNFIYNLVVRDESKHEKTNNTDLDQYLEGRKHFLVVHQLPKSIVGVPYNRLIWNVYDESNKEDPILLIGRMSVNSLNEIENVSYILDKLTVESFDQGIFLSKSENVVKEILARLNQDLVYRLPSNSFSDVVANKIEQFKQGKISKMEQRISRTRIHTFSKPESRLVKNKKYLKQLKDHIVIFGFELAIEKLLLKLRLHDLASTIVILEEDLSKFEPVVKDLLNKFTNLIVFECDFKDVRYLKECICLGKAKVALILKKEDDFQNLILFRMIEKFFKILTVVEIEVNSKHKLISSIIKSPLTKEIPSELMNSTFLRGECLFSHLLEVMPVLASKRPKEMFCATHLMSNDFKEMKNYSAAGESYMFKDVNIYSNATSVLSFEVPLEFVGKRYETLLSSFLNHEKLFIVLGLYVQDEEEGDSLPGQTEISNIEESETYSKGLFITNPSKNYVIKSNSEILLLGNLEKNRSKVREMEKNCFTQYAQKLAKMDLKEKKQIKVSAKIRKISKALRTKVSSFPIEYII